jgi:hypothetical protein
VLAVVIVVVIGVVAGGLATRGGKSGGPEACALLTRSEIAQTFGMSVEKVESDPSRNGSNSCYWTIATGLLGLSVSHVSPAEIRSDGPGQQPVPGFPNGRYTPGSSELLVGTRKYLILLEGPTATSQDQLIHLLRLIDSRL